MKKTGFTLTELIVAIGIVGVASAIISPMFTDLMPNQEKMKVLKYYKTINEINNELLSNKALYWTPFDGINSSCSGFECDQRPKMYPYNNTEYLYYDFAEGETKYPLLFVNQMDSVVETSDLEDGKLDIELKDSSLWTIEKDTNVGEYIISIDINGEDEGSNKSWKSNKKNPDTFVFNVLASGKVVANDDKLVKAYLQNPYDLKNKRKDYKTAKSIK